MGHPVVKATRVLTSGCHGVIKKGKDMTRTLVPTKVSKTAKCSARALQGVRRLPNKPMKSQRVVKNTDVPKKEAVSSRRVVTRVAVDQEPMIGKRARSNMLTALEMRSVSAEVQSQYQQYLNKFVSFCQANGSAWPLDVVECDNMMADYLDVMFVDGKSASEGEKTVAAAEYMSTTLKGKLVRSRRALKGWRKERPACSRLPLPRLIAAGMAMKMISSGRRLMGLKLMVDHDAYLRPGEPIDIAKKDVVRPVKGGGPQYRWYSVVIRDQEDGRGDKVGVFDNTIPFNSPGREYLGELLSHQADSLTSKLAQVFPFTADEYRKIHDASEDLNSKEREPLSVKARGRWATDQSVRRYGKIGKVQKLLCQLSPSNLAFCQWSLKNMEAVLRGMISARSR